MKRTLSTLFIVLLGSVSLYACGDDDDLPSTNNGSGGAGGSSEKAGSGGGKSGAGGTAGSSAGSAGGGAGGSAGAAGAAGASGSAGAAGQGGGSFACGAARDALLAPIDKVSEAKVFVTADTGAAGSGGATSVKTFFVDATGGGSKASADNPRVYISLSGPTRVDVTDFASYSSDAWDLALERPVIFANSGDVGTGNRSVALVQKAFNDVTADDATGATFAAETLFDAECNSLTNDFGEPLSTFADWYDYSNVPSHILSPKSQTYLVRRSDGTTFKLGIVSYYTDDEGDPLPPSEPNPPPHPGTAKYLFRVAQLTP